MADSLYPPGYKEQWAKVEQARVALTPGTVETVPSVTQQPQTIGTASTFTPPEGATPGPLTYKGGPEWYEKNGIKYYTPDSAMWGIGYRTSTEYQQQQNIKIGDKTIRVGGGSTMPGALAPHIAVTLASGEPATITLDQATQLQELSGGDKVRAMTNLGLLSQSDINKIRAASQELYNILMTGDFEAYNKAVAEQLATNTKLRKQFEQNNIQLADGTWMPRRGLPERVDLDTGQIYTATIGWQDLGQKYQNIGMNQGFDAMLAAIDADNQKIRDIMSALDKYTDDKGGVNLYLAIADYKEGRGGVNPDDLKLVFKDSNMVDRADKTVQASRNTGVALPGERNWFDLATGKTYTQEEFAQLVADYEANTAKLAKQGKMFTAEWDALGPHPRTTIRETEPTVNRQQIEVLETLFFRPAMALKPEIELKDVKPIDWAIGGAQLATWALPFTKGIVTPLVSGAASGVFALSTAQNWKDMSMPQRALAVAGDVAMALPILASVARGVRITSVKVPTAEGESVTWRGLSVAQNPVIGRSGGKWVVGARDITIPEAQLILDGYHPQQMLETKVFVNRNALLKAGFTEAQITYLTDTLQARNLFAGKKSPFLAEDEFLKGTDYIDPDEMALLLKQIQRYNKQIEHVDLLYGSPAIKAQLAPELRNWRILHDLDMHTTFNPEEAQQFVNETLIKLKKLPGNRQYRISPDSPVRIEKKIDGEWKHINDLKSEFIDPEWQFSDTPASKLDATGEYSYGRMVAEPAITIKYPGIGEFDIMSLSESGVRKADTILRVRQTIEGTAFKPPERGIAKPGVPKDAADFYVILKTFEEAKILKAGTANEWAESWARAMGYTSKELPEVLPNITKAMKEVASQTPSDLFGYRFTPSAKAAPSTASPSIMIHIPVSLSASVSPSLKRRISTPVSVSKPLPSNYASVLKTVMSSTSLSAKTSPSIKISPKLASAKPSVPTSPSPSPKPSPSISPTIKTRPSPGSPKPSPSPSPSSSPTPKPRLTPKPKPRAVPTETSISETKLRSYKGAVAWRQGALKHKGKLEPIYKVKRASESLETFFESELPPGVRVVSGGPKSAYKSIQLYKGKQMPEITEDIGAFLVTIKQPTSSPGKAGAIEFRRDPSDIPGRAGGTKFESLAKMPLGTTLEQIVRGYYPDKVPKETVDKILSQKLAKSTSEEIARVLVKAEGEAMPMSVGGQSKGYTQDEVLKYLPDRQKTDVLLWMEMVQATRAAPTRGYPKAQTIPSKLRRKKRKLSTGSKKESESLATVRL